MRQTHTYAVLDVSDTTYCEIAKKLRDAGYEQAFGPNGEIDMSGIAIAKKSYAFCESVAATGRSPWHIRELTAVGKKVTGGADTNSLCDRKMGWDLNVKITTHHLTHTCPKCVEAYRKVK